ncbi:MAG: CHAT domain-containing tetratricopeptide repeat protein [Bacteroidia bacterium]
MIVPRISGILFLFAGLFFHSFAQKSDTTGVWNKVVLAQQKLDSLQYDEALTLLDQAEDSYAAIGDQNKLTSVWLKKSLVHLGYLDFAPSGAYLAKAQKAIDAQNPKHKKNYADWLFIKGVLYHETAAYDSSLYYLRSYEPVCNEVYGPKSRQAGEYLYFFATSFLRKADYPLALDYAENALNIFTGPAPDSSWLGKTYNIIGFIYGEQGYLNQQIEFYQKSLTVNRALYGEEHYEVAVNYNNLAYTEGVKGNFHEAINFLLKCLKINEKNPKGNVQLLGSNYLNLGMDYAYVGDYGRADYYMAKALEVRTRLYGENHPDIANVYHNMGSVAMDLAEYEKSRKYFTKALEIRTRYLGEANPYVALSHTMLGRSLLNLRQNEEALIHLERGLAGLRAVLGDRHFMVANSYFDLALCLEEMGQMDKALENYTQAIAVVKNTAGADNAILTRLYDSYATALVNAGKKEEALAILQEGLIVVSEGFSDKNFLSNPTLSQMDFDITGIFILGQKANVLLKAGYGNTKAGLQAIWETYLLTDSLIQKMRLGFFNEKSRELLSTRFLSVYENAIGVAWKISEQTGDKSFLQQAFGLAEKAKSMLLFQAVRENQAMITAGIPADLLHREQYLRAEVGYCEKVIYEERQKSSDGDSLRLLDAINRHFSLTRERNELIRTFEKDFPEYYRLKFDDHVATVNEVQKRLSSQDAMLTYFTGENHIYSFLITQTGFAVERTATGPQWHRDLEKFIGYMKDTEMADQKAYTSENFRIFTRNAYQLYTELISPFEKTLTQATDLIIVPDGLLGYIPFEMLISKPGGEQVDYVSLPYLLREWQVRYAYSATLFCTPAPPPRKRRSLFAGFAPGTGQSGSVNSPEYAMRGAPRPAKLYANQPEVSSAAALLKGKSWLSQAATESAFRENAEKYKILHLATHAWVSDENPLYSGLWFVSELSGDSLQMDSLALNNEEKDGFLHAYEIYNMFIPADLTVLSACETGGGTLRRGEGIMSLARAFRYAGSPNVMMTLWKAEDVATRELMERFYRNLREGMEKDAALRKAKLDFLSDTDRQHPHFWAEFVLIGDEVPVKPGTPWWILALAVGVVVAIVVLIALRNKARQPVA